MKLLRQHPFVIPMALGLVIGVVLTVAVAVGSSGGGNDERPKLPRETGAATAPTAYTVEGTLPALPERAEAYELRGTVTAARVVALAKALGLEGEATQAKRGWSVSDGARTLQVGTTDGLRWTFAPVRPKKDEATTTTTAAPTPTPTEAPDRAAAERTARETLTAAGADLAGAAVSAVERNGGWQFTFDPRVDGVPTRGWSTTAVIGADGTVTTAGGHLAEPVSLGTYELVDTTDALERLKAGTGEADAADGEDGPRPAVTGVRLALVFARSAEGSPAYLVPAAEFTRGRGTRVAAVAVTDEHLLAAAPPKTKTTKAGPATTRVPRSQSCATSTNSVNGAAAKTSICRVQTPGERDVTFNVVFDVDPGLPCAPTIDFGDGASEAVAKAEGRQRFQHTYAGPGTYQVRLGGEGCSIGGPLGTEVTVT